MRIEREQIWIASACFAALGLLLSDQWPVLCAYVLFFLLLVVVKRLWRPLPKKTLRSVGILLSLIVVSFAWSENLSGGIVAGLKVIGLFLVSISVMRGIGPAGINRAVRGLAHRVPGTWAQTSALVLMPFLMSRLYREWKVLDTAIREKGPRLGRVRRPVYKLRALFWKSQNWPEKIFLANTLRAGPMGEELKLPGEDAIRFLDISTLVLSVSAFVLSIVIGRQ